MKLIWLYCPSENEKVIINTTGDGGKTLVQIRWSFNDACGEVFGWLSVLVPHRIKADCCLTKCTYVPLPRLNPTIGSLNYKLVHLPKILSQRSLSEKLGHSPAGTLSLIGFQGNALKCRLKAFLWSLGMNEKRTFYLFSDMLLHQRRMLTGGEATVSIMCSMPCFLICCNNISSNFNHV